MFWFSNSCSLNQLGLLKSGEQKQLCTFWDGHFQSLLCSEKKTTF